MWIFKVLGNVLKGVLLIVAALIVAVQCTSSDPAHREVSDNPVENMDWTPRSF